MLYLENVLGEIKQDNNYNIVRTGKYIVIHFKILSKIVGIQCSWR